MPPLVTSILLIINVAVFLLQQVTGDLLLVHFALWPLGPHQPAQLDDGSMTMVGFEPWQVVSYSFMHGSMMHIGFNMLALWMFGGPVENALGARRYAFFYLACVLGAAFAQLATTHFFQPADFYPTLGASGGVFGLLLAYALYFPNNRVMLLFPPIPMPARVFVLLYAALELVMGVTGAQSGVAHFAHLGGMVGGYLMLRYWRGAGPTWRRRF